MMTYVEKRAYRNPGEETDNKKNKHYRIVKPPQNGNLPLFCIEKDTRDGVLYAPFACVLMVRETGLEPVWINHTPLKRARLPVPPLARGTVIL